MNWHPPVPASAVDSSGQTWQIRRAWPDKTVGDYNLEVTAPEFIARGHAGVRGVPQYPGCGEGPGVQEAFDLCAAFGGHNCTARPEDFDVASIGPDDGAHVRPIGHELPVPGLRPQ